MQSFPENVVIAVDPANSIEMLAPIQRMSYLEKAHVHIVHVARKFEYVDGMAFGIAFPIDENEPHVRKAVIEKLKSMASEILPYGHSGKVTYECLFSHDPKEEFVHHLIGTQADLAIISTRERHGLFESSFASYVAQHAKTNVLFIKQSEAHVKKFHQVVVALKLDESEMQLLKLASLPFLKGSRIHLVHLVPSLSRSTIAGINLDLYTNPDKKLVLEQAINTRLTQIQSLLQKSGLQNEDVSFECLFSEDIKQDFKQRANQLKSELNIIFAKEKTRPFRSMAQYQLAKTSTPLLLLK